MKKFWGRITAITDLDSYDGLLGALSIILNIDGAEEEVLHDGKIKLVVYTSELEKLKALSLGDNVKVETIEYDPAIETKWKEYFKPQRVGKNIIIKPSWEKYSAQPDDIVVTIDPGAAFGTGLHGTTKGVIISLEKIVSGIKDLNKIRLLDAGTGSGILAIAAYKLGIKDITAIDNDIEAVNTTKENFLLNSIPLDKIKIEQKELYDEKGTYDIILANILAELLIQESTLISSLLRPSAHLILSGILIREEEKVLKAFSKIKTLSFIDKVHIDEWTTICFSSVVAD